MRRRFVTLDVFTDQALRRQSARRGARARRPRHRRDADDRARVQSLRNRVRVSARRQGRTARSCASSRRRASFRSPVIRRSAPRCCSGASTAAGERTFTLEEKIGPVPCRVKSSGADSGQRVVRHSAPAREGSGLAGCRRDGGGARPVGRRHGLRRIRARRAGRREIRSPSCRCAGSTRSGAAALDLARFDEAFGGGDHAAAFIFCRETAEAGHSVPRAHVRARSWACTKIRRPARRSRRSPAIWRRAAATRDGEHVVRHRAGLRDGAREPDRADAEDRRRQAAPARRSAAARSSSWKAPSRLDRAAARLRRRARMDDIPIIPLDAARPALRAGAVAVRGRAARRDRRAFREAARREAGDVERPRAAAAARRRSTAACSRGAYLETDFASFLAWRDWGFPDRRCATASRMAALRSADGAFLLGVMGRHTATAGQIYFPAGTPDPTDIVGRDGRPRAAA